MFESIKRNRKGAKILIADDHKVLLETLEDWISLSLPETRVISAHDGKEALYLALLERPDLVLLDIEMPLMNGIEVTRKIKDSLPATKVIILTLYDTEAHYSAAKAAGASAFISKSKIKSLLIPVISKYIEKEPINLDT